MTIDCDNTERIDDFNGFLMCPAHDALFDKGYISFTDSGEIIIYGDLDTLSQKLLNVNPYLRVQLNERNMPTLIFTGATSFGLS